MCTDFCFQLHNLMFSTEGRHLDLQVSKATASVLFDLMYFYMTWTELQSPLTDQLTTTDAISIRQYVWPNSPTAIQFVNTV